MAKKNEETREGLSGSLYESSDTRALEESHWIIHAPQGVGKTTLFVTLSDATPQDLLANKKSGKPFVIEDLVHIGADKDPLVGLAQYKGKLVHYIPLRKLLGPQRKGLAHFEDVMDALDAITDDVGNKVCKHNIKAVGVDTLTSLSTMIVKHAENLDFRSEKTGKPDNYAKWGYIGHALTVFWEWACTLPCMVFFLCHSKPFGDENSVMTRQDQLKLRATKGVGQWDIVPGMDGKKAFEVYTGHSSFIGTMEAECDDKGQWSRYVLPRGGRGFLGKNRWFDCLSDREPADMKYILKKILSGGGK